VRLTALPAPDRLDFDLPEGYFCLVADEGSPTGIELAHRLTERGWRVVQLRLPGQGQAERAGAWPGLATAALDDWGENTLTASLARLERDFGPLGAFIHLQPAGESQPLAIRQKDSLKWLFLAAKHLKRPLTEAARHGHSCFVATTRLDGQIGLGQTSAYAAVNGGVFGLTKTLNLEWPDVFCRAVDVSPAFTPERAAQAIVAELYDPNRLIVETGWNEAGRVTLSIGDDHELA
jgi:NAD(P)-dependent dehydrogenase (short-subunit alcohol dehydrogenase family)